MILTHKTALVGKSKLTQPIPGIDTTTHLHLNLGDFGIVYKGRTITPRDVMASPAAFDDLYMPWNAGLETSVFLRDAVCRVPTLTSVSVEGETVAPVPHNNVASPSWGKYPSARVMKYIGHLALVTAVIGKVLGRQPVWYGAGQIIPAYVRPTATEHHAMRRERTQWYSGVGSRLLLPCQSFYQHKDGPRGNNRTEWINTALAMHMATLRDGEAVTVFLSPVVNGSDSEGWDSFDAMTKDEYATDYRTIAGHPCPCHVVEWMHSDTSARTAKWADIIERAKGSA